MSAAKGMGNSQGAHPTKTATVEVNENLYAFKPFVLMKCEPEAGGIVPKPRSGHRIVCNDVNLYCYGGYNPDLLTDADLAQDENWTNSKPLFKELWKLNIAKNSWERLNVRNIPPYLASSSVLLDGPFLIAYCGTEVPFGVNQSNTVYVCDVSRPRLEFKNVNVTGVPPVPCYGAAMFRTGKYLYTIGGTTGYEYSPDVHRLDLVNKVWEPVSVAKGLPDEPFGRYRHGLCVFGSKVYVLGGGSPLGAFGFEEINAFDYSTNKWLIVKTYGDSQRSDPYPRPRMFHSVNRIPNSCSVVILGGYDWNNTLSDCWVLDLNTLKWKNVQSLEMPTPTRFHDSCITPSGKLYTFGGAYKIGHNFTRTSNLFTTWCCIPKLKEIAWEAVMHYGILNHCKDAEALLPVEFRIRLSGDPS